MLRNPLLFSVALASLLASSCVDDKQQDKGVVDTSFPPESPLAIEKADSLSNLRPIAVESAHPYANDLNSEFVIDLEEVVPTCTSEVRLHFAALQLETDYDFLSVVDSNGQVVQRLTGAPSEEFSEWIPVREDERLISLVLDTDYSVVRHGFRVDGVEWASDLVCPLVVPTLCPANTVDVTPPLGDCQCPGARVCAPVDQLQARHAFAGGVAGGFRGTLFEGTEAYSTSNFSRTNPHLGSIDAQAIRSFMAAAVGAGMLHTQSNPDAGNMTEEFSLNAGSQSMAHAHAAGTYPAEQAAIIAQYDALFVCGEGQPLTCAEGNTCDNGSCVAESTCVCAEIFAPVCGENGQTFANRCLADCNEAVQIAHDGACGIAGDFCGGLLGRTCQDEFRCRFGDNQFEYPFPDASGSCVAENYCDVPANCEGLPHIAVPGQWACEENTCSWAAGSPWTTVPNWQMETHHPYANNESLWTKLFAPEGSTQVRIELVTDFSLEKNYDFLEVWSWNGSSWVKAGQLSDTQPAGEEFVFDGRYHYLHFVSDSSVTDSGFSLSASYK